MVKPQALTIADPAAPQGGPAPSAAPTPQAYGYPRRFHGSPTVYTVISPRARGLSIGVNLNPDRHCNFDCVYCEVKGDKPETAHPCDVEATAAQLQHVLSLAHSGTLRLSPPYQAVPEELMRLREVALSGDGEPTLCPNFADVLGSVLRLRAVSGFPFFKIVLITNASGLTRPQVQSSLKALTSHDEIWAKLDAGTQAWMDRVNRPKVDLETIHANILAASRERPLVIQSLFPQFSNTAPPAEEIDAYAARLNRLLSSGAQLDRIQIYSAHRPVAHPECSHLPLRTLSQIARRVREKTGLCVEVY